MSAEVGSQFSPVITSRQLIGEVDGGKYGDLAPSLGDGFHGIEPSVFVQRVKVADMVLGSPEEGPQPKLAGDAPVSRDDVLGDQQRKQVVEDDSVGHCDAWPDEVDEFGIPDTAYEPVTEPLPGEPVAGLDPQAPALTFLDALLILSLDLLGGLIAGRVVTVAGQVPGRSSTSTSSAFPLGLAAALSLADAAGRCHGSALR